MTEVGYLVSAQGCKDESFFPHDAIWELLLPILVPCIAQGKCELGQLGITELERKAPAFNFKGQEGESSAPAGVRPSEGPV